MSITAAWCATRGSNSPTLPCHGSAHPSEHVAHLEQSIVPALLDVKKLSSWRQDSHLHEAGYKPAAFSSSHSSVAHLLGIEPSSPGLTDRRNRQTCQRCRFLRSGLNRLPHELMRNQSCLAHTSRSTGSREPGVLPLGVEPSCFRVRNGNPSEGRSLERVTGIEPA